MAYRLTELAESLPSTVPFVGPEAQERLAGRVFKARLGANENVFGASPKALAALAEADHWAYADPESHDLRAALARHLGVGAENIVVGEGIDGLLGYLVRLIIGPGDAVVTSDGAYPTFNYHVAGYGGVLHKVPFAQDREDLPGLCEKAREVGAKLVYLANPDNPMGTWWRGEEIVEALSRLPDTCLLVLDEAYIECAPDAARAVIDIEDPRVIRMRTFSKAYGLAGARVGYGIGPAGLIEAFDKVRNHFGLGRGAQAAALAALEDQAHLDHVLAQIRRARAEIGEIAGANGLRALASATNFVAVDCGRDGAFATAVMKGLIERGIFVRMPGPAPQNRCIRISCGRDADLDLLRVVLPEVLADVKFS